MNIQLYCIFFFFFFLLFCLFESGCFRFWFGFGGLSVERFLEGDVERVKVAAAFDKYEKSGA